MGDLKQAINLCVAVEGKPNEIPGFDKVIAIESYTGVFGIICKQNKTVYIIFQGSNDAKDWFIDMLAIPSVYKFGWRDILPCNWFRSRQRVHVGFREGYVSIKNKVMKRIEEFEQLSKIIIAGHSYGGALATLCSIDIAKQYPNTELKTYLFASPRVGNEKFTAMFNNKIENCVNIRYYRDAIPQLPPEIFGYRHVGKQIILGDDRVLQEPEANFFHLDISDLEDIKNILIQYGSSHNIIRYRMLINSLL